MQITPKLNLQTLYFPGRLADDLENIKIYPLTVLEAPSGFGKTTALEEFFSQKYFKNINIYKQTFFSQNTEEYWQRFCQVLAETDSICAEALKGFKAPNGEKILVPINLEGAAYAKAMLFKDMNSVQPVAESRRITLN